MMSFNFEEISNTTQQIKAKKYTLIQYGMNKDAVANRMVKKIKSDLF